VNSCVGLSTQRDGAHRIPRKAFPPVAAAAASPVHTQSYLPA